jgi:hypothetical protein
MNHAHLVAQDQSRDHLVDPLSETYTIVRSHRSPSTLIACTVVESGDVERSPILQAVSVEIYGAQPTLFVPRADKAT